MRCTCKLLLFVFGLLAPSLLPSRASNAQYKTAQLTSEQLQVYGDFLESFSKMNFKFLSNRTFPLDPSRVGKDAACLKGLQIEAEKAGSTVHVLGPGVLRGRSVRLIDGREESAILKERDEKTSANGADSTNDKAIDPGVLAISEIVFDNSHHFALLKYVFLCGSHCNSGAILILEKVGSQWIGTTRRPCSFVLNDANPRG